MPGAPIPLSNMRKRVETLERETHILRREIEAIRRGAAGRLSMTGEVKVAKTIAVSSYPSAPANVFGIRFATASFTRSEGNQTPTYSYHSASAQDYAWSPWGYVEEGSIVLVSRMRNGQWVIVSDFGKKKLIRFTLAEDLTTSDGDATATIQTEYGIGAAGTSGAGNITVHNLLTHTAGVYTFFGDNGDAGWAYHDSEDDYIIIMFECDT